MAVAKTMKEVYDWVPSRTPWNNHLWASSPPQPPQDYPPSSACPAPWLSELWPWQQRRHLRQPHSRWDCVPAGLCGGWSFLWARGMVPPGVLPWSLSIYLASARSQSVAVLAEICGFSGIHDLGYSLGPQELESRINRTRKTWTSVYSLEYMWKLWKGIKNKTKFTHIPKTLLDLFLFIYRYIVLINLDHRIRGSEFLCFHFS